MRARTCSPAVLGRARSASVISAWAAAFGTSRWKTAGPRAARARTASRSAGVAAVRFATTSTRARSVIGRAALRHVFPGQREVGDGDEDRAEEDRARHRRAEAQPAVGACLREVVADRGAERPGEDVGDPEGGDGVQPEAVVRDRDDRDRPREEQRRDQLAEVQPLGGQVAGGRAEGEREEDGQPVERLAAGREDRVDRQRALARVPDGERRSRARWRRRSSS